MKLPITFESPDEMVRLLDAITARTSVELVNVKPGDPAPISFEALRPGMRVRYVREDGSFFTGEVKDVGESWVYILKDENRRVTHLWGTIKGTFYQL